MNKKLPRLFARGNSGKVLEWEIEVVGNKFRTITGSVDDQHVTSDWTIVSEGKNVGKKNATTPEEQAFSEAESRWDKKQKSGGYWLNIKDIDKSKFVEPMLANHYKDRTGKIKFPVMVDRKYNGMRQITTRNGQFSRKGEKIISAPHIFERVKHLFDKHPNLVIDGELYNHTLRFQLNELIKLVNKKKLSTVTSSDFNRSKEIVDYYVYDAYGFVIDDVEITRDTVCSERREALTKLLSCIDDVIAVEFRWANNDDEVMQIFDSDVDEGYEGSIVRVNTSYQNKRTNDLLKVKSEDDDECVIKSISEGTGNWSDTAKTATINWNGNEFDATFKGSYEELQEVLKNQKQWCGKKVTFLYFGLTGKGIPNSARIDINNCFKGD